MTMTLQDVCRTLGKYGFAATAEGDHERQFVGVATLEEADESRISFLSNPKYEKMLSETGAGAVVLKPDIPAPDGLATVRTADPYAAITALIVEMHGYRKHQRIVAEPGVTQIAKTAEIGKNACIYPGATIDDGARIGANATIYSGVYVGPRCRIGDNVILFPNVVIYDDCVIGNRVTIHAGTSIGNDGLGYAPINGTWVKIPQIGIVEIEDDVEIGANCAIDRATLGRTRIGRGTKTSNLIAIGHGTEVGAHCMLVAQVGLAGSVKVGSHVTMAGQVGVVGHVSIGDHATIGAKAGVTNNVPENETVLGQPAIPIGDMRRQVVHVQRLPELAKQVKKLEAEIAKLRAELQANA
ncbi:MAG: UDP-3-O-(3-hydroxymyristoyl)glucosamine N-acyltransferase [Phycisphaerae bacterium]